MKSHLVEMPLQIPYYYYYYYYYSLLVSRDFVAPNGRSRAHIGNILNYATPGLTNKKRLGTPLSSQSLMIT